MKSEEVVIYTKDLSRTFGNFTAVDAISFEVKRGEIFGFLGANGAGKTTAMKMLCGLLSPTSGIGKVGGFSINNQAEDIKKIIGYMSQKFSLYGTLTVRENIHFFGGIYGIPRQKLKQKVSEIIEKLHLTEYENRLVNSLPQGWRQKIAFSTAIIHNPAVVFLDEPTGGVDPVTRRQFWDLIYESAERGITSFVTTHYMDEAEYCNRVSIMVDGRIEALDSPENLKAEYDAASMEEVFFKLARNAKRSQE